MAHMIYFCSSDGYSKKEVLLDWTRKNPHTRIDFFSSPTFKIKNIKLKETCEDKRLIGKIGKIYIHYTDNGIERLTSFDQIWHIRAYPQKYFLSLAKTEVITPL